LPKVLAHFHSLGYRFEAVTQEVLAGGLPLRKTA